jgi:drug/metabolite transporter superfamily protein YnfA
MKKVSYKRILIFASIGVFPLIIVSPIITHMHHVLLGRGGVFFGGQFFLGTLQWERSNKGVMRSFLGSIARQLPVSNNR